MLGNLFKAAIDIATLPVDIAKDSLAFLDMYDEDDNARRKIETIKRELNGER